MDLVYVTMFGFTLPLWALFLILIVAVIIVWKLIKFAIKILLVIIVFFLILFGLDLLGVFDILQGIISNFI
jgi:hypothetical protein